MGSDASLAPIGFAVGWGPIPWLLMSEIFPLHVKGVATGVCVLTNWFMAFLVTKEFSSVMVSAGLEGLPLTVGREHYSELFLTAEDSGLVASHEG